jgi:hypothetical protein
MREESHDRCANPLCGPVTIAVLEVSLLVMIDAKTPLICYAGGSI